MCQNSPRPRAGGAVVVISLQAGSSVPQGEGHTVMLGLVAKGQECGGVRMWPRCPCAKAHAVAPAGGGLDLGGHVPRPARPSNKGDKGELVLRGVPMPTSQSTSSRLPPTLQMGKLRPREGEHFACSHGTQAQPQAWDLLGPALGCSPVLLRATAVGEGLLPPRWDTPPPPPGWVEVEPWRGLLCPRGHPLPCLDSSGVLGVGRERGLGSPVLWVSALLWEDVSRERR